MDSKRTKIPPELWSRLRKWLLERNTVINCWNYCYPYPSSSVKDRIVAEANRLIDADGGQRVNKKRLEQFLNNNRSIRPGTKCSRMLAKLIEEKEPSGVTLETIASQYNWKGAEKKATRALLNRPTSTRHSESTDSASSPESTDSTSHPKPKIARLFHSSGVNSNLTKGKWLVVRGLGEAQSTSHSESTSHPQSASSPESSDSTIQPKPTTPPLSHPLGVRGRLTKGKLVLVQGLEEKQSTSHSESTSHTESISHTESASPPVSPDSTIHPKPTTDPLSESSYVYSRPPKKLVLMRGFGQSQFLFSETIVRPEFLIRPSISINSGKHFKKNWLSDWRWSQCRGQT